SRCRTGGEIQARVLAFTEQANAAVARRSREEGRRIGSTMAMLVFRQDGVHLFSVGDSPVFRLAGGRLEKLTQDDTFAQLLVKRGELTPAQAARDPRRNSLTQHIGMTDVALRLHCSCDIPVAAGDRYLLCSDGLTDMVPARAAASLLASAGTAQEAADSLVLAALEAGGRDNVTALTLFVGE
ncbi:MAG: serine/threonine-protein phosphatase, partial [Oscillospiraceae bacterium]|nr:serine/threonine-protein phosphatase [Oscillospiraceae bacterium]